MYGDGYYRTDGERFTATVAWLLGDAYRPAHRKTAEEFARGLLWEEGKILPDRTAAPLLNLSNGMLDLRTGTLSRTIRPSVRGCSSRWRGTRTRRARRMISGSSCVGSRTR
jgi:hypothetical protein